MFLETCLCLFISATNIDFEDLILSDGFKLLNIILYVRNNSFHAHYFLNSSSSDFQWMLSLLKQSMKMPQKSAKF